MFAHMHICQLTDFFHKKRFKEGTVAPLVEYLLSMREAPGSKYRAHHRLGTGAHLSFQQVWRQKDQLRIGSRSFLATKQICRQRGINETSHLRNKSSIAHVSTNFPASSNGTEFADDRIA